MAFVGEIQDTQSLISCFPEISWRSPKCFGKYSVAWQDRSIPFKTTSYEQSNGGLSVWLGVIGTMNLSTRKSWRKMPGHKFVAEAQAHLIMHQDKRKTSSRAPLNGWTGIVQTEIWLKCVRMTSDRLLMLSSPPVKLKQSCSLKGARLASKMRKTLCKWSQILDCKFWRQGWHKND